jgi:hypothetical protein
MAKKLFITNERMLQLMDWAINEEIAENETRYLEAIGFPRTNISNVREGIQSFTKDHIMKACKLTGASADYIFGFTTNMKRKPESKPLDALKQAVKAVELELRRK